VLVVVGEVGDCPVDVGEVGHGCAGGCAASRRATRGWRRRPWRGRV
jgi:hypothetical protein